MRVSASKSCASSCWKYRNSTSPKCRSRMCPSESFSGSCTRAPAAAAASSASVAAISSAPIERRYLKGLFPVLDLELRLEFALPIVDLELEILGADALFEAQGRAAPVGARVGSGAAEEGDQLVRTDLEIAEVQSLHAPLQQRIALTRSVEIVDDFLLIEFQLDRIEREEIADVHRQEHRQLGVGGEQQLLLEDEQILVEIDHIFLQSLDVLVEPAGLGISLRGRRWRRSSRCRLGRWRCHALERAALTGEQLLAWGSRCWLGRWSFQALQCAALTGNSCCPGAAA